VLVVVVLLDQISCNWCRCVPIDHRCLDLFHIIFAEQTSFVVVIVASLAASNINLLHFDILHVVVISTFIILLGYIVLVDFYLFLDEEWYFRWWTSWHEVEVGLREAVFLRWQTDAEDLWYCRQRNGVGLCGQCI